MNGFSWGSFWAGFVAFPLAVLAIGLLIAAFLRAIDKNLGKGDCVVCDQAFTCDIGDYTRLGIWFRSRRHNWFIRNRKWHRDAWANHRWNPYRLPGVADSDSRGVVARRPKPHVLRRAWWFVFG